MSTSQQIIYTINANCQDCYRCVRECPVKAIKINSGQAMIEGNLCIKCGNCVRECPQYAKIVRSDLAMARSIFTEEKVVVASVAPSFPVLFPGVLTRLLPSALRQLGFKYVCETAEGAKHITDQSFAKPFKGNICTACPAVVNYVEKYRPEHTDKLIPVVSPMVAHGRMLKEKFPDCAVVFIGPCAAKKDESQREENLDAIDYVITFAELLEWFSSEGLQLENCTESDFDKFFEVGEARLFPLHGGMLRTGGIYCDDTQLEVLHLSGSDEVIALFEDSSNIENKLIEPLFCKGGCINGPCFESEFNPIHNTNMFNRRDQIITYASEATKRTFPLPNNKSINSQAIFHETPIKLEDVSENKIQKILEHTGKVNSSQQLNCGACGYKSCLENAYAVARGMAELDMCLPHMIQLAHLRNDKIIELSPNGVVMLDSELCIMKMNPAFQKMFSCNNGIIGRRISYLVNAQGFESLQSGAKERYESIQSKYGIKYHEMIFALPEEGQYVGIFADVSKMKYDSRQLDAIKMQTLQHARDFLDHQIKFSQEMAHFLGKSAAQSEEMAKYLIDLYAEADEGENVQQ